MTKEKILQEFSDINHVYNNCTRYDTLKHMLDELTASKTEHWVPVSERLPEAEYGESDSVLVCFEDETQDVLYFDGGNWCYPTGETYVSVNHKNGWHNKVIAWMPLPKRYEPQERSGEE